MCAMAIVKYPMLHPRWATTMPSCKCGRTIPADVQEPSQSIVKGPGELPGTDMLIADHLLAVRLDMQDWILSTIGTLSSPPI